MFTRNTLAHWLIDVEGIDGRTAAQVIALDRSGLARRDEMAQRWPDIYERIQAAYDGLYCYTENC